MYTECGWEEGQGGAGPPTGRVPQRRGTSGSQRMGRWSAAGPCLCWGRASGRAAALLHTLNLVLHIPAKGMTWVVKDRWGQMCRVLRRLSEHTQQRQPPTVASPLVAAAAVKVGSGGASSVISASEIEISATEGAGAAARAHMYIWRRRSSCSGLASQ